MFVQSPRFGEIREIVSVSSVPIRQMISKEVLRITYVFIVECFLNFDQHSEISVAYSAQKDAALAKRRLQSCWEVRSAGAAAVYNDCKVHTQ